MAVRSTNVYEERSLGLFESENFDYDATNETEYLLAGGK